MSTTHANQEISLASTSPADVDLDHLPTVTLNRHKIGHAKFVARQRARSYENYSGNTVHGDHSSYSAHLVGVVGELAVTELYGGSIDAHSHSTGDDGFDLRFGQHTVDVKTTRTRSVDRPDLLISPESELVADLYFLAHWFDEGRVRILGYAARSNIVKREPERYPGTSLNYVVPADELLLPPNLPQLRG